MKKVLIVDDEKFIKQGIAAIINKDFVDEIETDFASDGKEALDKINRTKYDLVISDISMPIMNGMELIEEISKLNEKPEVIVLSGYNEFEYARGCLKFGVKNYLLKPVKRHEFVENIKAVFNNLEEEQEKTEGTLLKELKYELLNKPDEYEIIEELLEKLNMKAETYKCYYVKNDSEIYSDEIVNDKNIIYISNKDNSGYYIVNNSTSINLDAYKLLIESDYQSSLVDAFEQVEALKKYRLILGKNHISPKDVLERDYISTNDDKAINICKNLKLGKLELVWEIFSELFSDDKIKKYDYQSFKEIHQSLIRNIFYDRNLYQQFNKKFDELEFENIKEYLKEVKACLMAASEKFKDNNTIEVIHIEEAKEFIAKNYNKDLNMAVVSNHVSLNYTYFSGLFKKYMNVNFSEYLHQVRIEESKKYLKRLDYKIYEIAEEVGYKSSKHYTRKFKMLEKITPMEFRVKNNK